MLMTKLAHAQKIMGLVIEKDDKGVEQPLPGATVIWLGSTKGTTTGTNGVFLLDKLDGYNRIVVSYVGYKADTITYEGQSPLKIELKPETLNEVVVQGWRSSAGMDQLKPINTVVMTRKNCLKLRVAT